MDRTEFNERFRKARRAVIEKDFASLNEMQRQAVLTTEGPLLLLAGAGSGKTTVLINRIVNLIRYGRGSDTDEVPEWAVEGDLAVLEATAQLPEIPDPRIRTLCQVEPAEPWRILAITFTNKAADELKSRLLTALGEESQDVWAMTFHAACVRILRRFIEALGYSRSFTIYDTADSVAVMKRVLKDVDLDEKAFPPKTVLGQLSRAKDAMKDPETFLAEAEKSYDPRLKRIGQAYAEYQKRLKSADAVDFDDLIYLTVRLLAENREAREYCQKRFKYVLVDEYQDTSLLQYRLVSLLAGEYKNICVVGDDDQSIYRFRGATIENILSFEKTYENARVIKLEQNYRSTAHILEAANAVIRHNQGRKGKELWTALGDGEKPKLYVAQNEDEEAQYIAGAILNGITEGMNFRDFAVLYRMNAQSNRLEFALKRQGIPYKVVGGTRFFDRAEIKDVTSYLCAVQNPADDLRLLRVVNNPPRGIGAATLEAVRTLAARETRSIFDVMSRAEDYPELKRAAARLKEFTGLIAELREKAGEEPLDEFYDTLLTKTGYLASLGTTDEALARVDNIRELKSNILAYMEHAEQPTLAGFLDEIALYTDLDSLEEEGNNVILMTMHAAKGLEFPCVFVAGMEDGIFPSMRSIGEEEEMEEERRLCYVALTRARRRLILTAARQRMLFGRTSSNMLSRFVEEIPEEHIDKPVQRPRDLPADWDTDGGYAWGEENAYRASRYGGSGYGDRYGSGYTSGGWERGAESRRNEKSRPWERTERKPAYGAGPTASGGVRTRREAPRPGKKTAETPQPAPLLALAVGDRVKHKAFGTGVVKAYTAMPGDALLVIDFEEKGEKKLMLKTAGAFMQKLED